MNLLLTKEQALAALVAMGVLAATKAKARIRFWVTPGTYLQTFEGRDGRVVVSKATDYAIKTTERYENVDAYALAYGLVPASSYVPHRPV